MSTGDFHDDEKPVTHCVEFKPSALEKAVAGMAGQHHRDGGAWLSREAVLALIREAYEKGFDEAREMIASNAEEIARRLFVSGLDQQQVERLVLTTEDGRDRGGWCFDAVRDRIADAIRAMKPKAEQGAE